MPRGIMFSWALSSVVFLFLNGVAISEVAGQQPPQPPAQPGPAQTPSELQRIHSDLQKLQSQLSARDEAEKRIERYLQIIAAAIVIVSVMGILLQSIAFRLDAGNRRLSQEENQRQRVREEELNAHFRQILDATTGAQRRVEVLQEGGIRRAAETLQLINSLLAITERTAAKAAGAQHEFLSRSIETFDNECLNLVRESTKSDERDIVAKPLFRERVRVLTQQIQSLDNQIVVYNESVPRQFVATEEAEQAGSRPDGLRSAWAWLGLTGPCLFIRGLNHHVHQNFEAAIADWKSSIEAANSTPIKVDANYWISYVNNTLGRYDQAVNYLEAAVSIAPEHRRIELKRLLLETRFFALDFEEVPEWLLEEGRRLYETLTVYRTTSKRALSSFATMMGNISMIRSIRSGAAGGDFSDSTAWFERALEFEDRSRWARFGKCQNLVLSNAPFDADAQKEARDVITSVNREYQHRIEDRSKVLSKFTEYMCMLMLGSRDDPRMSSTAGLVEQHASNVEARTIYSQLRKQNVDKDVFLEEFAYLRESGNILATSRWANAKRDRSSAVSIP